MKVAILIHGFNVTKPELTVGKLGPFLRSRGYHVVMFRYGHTNLFQVRLRNKPLAKQLAALVELHRQYASEVHVFCHSNGATITHLATTQYAADIDAAICINPALTRNLNPARDAKFVHVYYNDDDRAVQLGKWLRWLTPLARAARPWGEMGRHGYNGRDCNVTNFDTEHDFDESARGHSGVFKEPTINYFGDIIAEIADKHIGYYA